MVHVEQAQDLLSGFFSVVALEGLHIDAGGVGLAESDRELHLAVYKIIVLDEPSNETNDDYWPHGGSNLGSRLSKACLDKDDDDGAKGQDRSTNRNTKSTKED